MSGAHGSAKRLLLMYSDQNKIDMSYVKTKPVFFCIYASKLLGFNTQYVGVNNFNLFYSLTKQEAVPRKTDRMVHLLNLMALQKERSPCP